MSAHPYLIGASLSEPFLDDETGRHGTSVNRAPPETDAGARASPTYIYIDIDDKTGTTSVTRAPPEHEMAARARAHTHAIAIRIL